MKEETYKVQFTHSSRDDMRKMKKYILETFKYHEYGENFTRKMKEAAGRHKLEISIETMVKRK